MRRKDPAAGPRRLGAYIVGNLTHELNRRVDEGLRLRRIWAAAVAEALAAHAYPVRYAAGLLFVHVDTPAWASRLRHQQSALISALRRDPALRDLTELRVRVVPPESAETPTADRRAPSRLSAQAAKVIERTAVAISDPDLRAALERLAQRGGAAPLKRKP